MFCLFVIALLVRQFPFKCWNCSFASCSTLWKRPRLKSGLFPSCLPDKIKMVSGRGSWNRFWQQQCFSNDDLFQKNAKEILSRIFLVSATFFSLRQPLRRWDNIGWSKIHGSEVCFELKRATFKPIHAAQLHCWASLVWRACAKRSNSVNFVNKNDSKFLTAACLYNILFGADNAKTWSSPGNGIYSSVRINILRQVISF